MIIAKIEVYTDGKLSQQYDRHFESDVDMNQYIKEANNIIPIHDQVVVKEYKHLLVE